jgi:hypothetical protein
LAHGGAVGLLFAIWGAQALVAGYGSTIDVTPDLRVLAFAAAMALGAGLLFGLVLAPRAVKSDVAPLLKGTEPVLRVMPGRLKGRFQPHSEL